MFQSIQARAGKFAAMAHEGQVDDDGRDYFEHPAEVAEILEMVGITEEGMAAAYLHDIIENTKYTREDLEKEFGKTVADLVFEVTHVGDKSTGYSFPNLHSREAVMIKLADRLNNLSRMASWNEKRKEHYIKKSKELLVKEDK